MLLSALTLSFAAPVKADLIGTIVTGQMLIPGFSGNFFDPANGFVPPTGFQNSSTNFNSPTVPISATATEFGFKDGLNTISADFGGSTLSQLDISGGNTVSITYKFTDSAFAGLVLTKSNDTFPGGVTADLTGTTITIVTPSFVSPGTYNAVFTLLPLVAVPEPSQYAMAGVAGLFMAGLATRRRRSAA